MVVSIPTELQPRWRDLPALAWLVTIRFGGPVVGLPVLGRLACAGGWLNTLAVLAGARAERACAGYRHNAVVAVTRRQPRRLRWRRWLVLAAVVPAMVVYLGAPPMALMVAGAAGEPDARLRRRLAARSGRVPVPGGCAYEPKFDGSPDALQCLIRVSCPRCA